MSLPRLSYQECADKAAVDFRMAADLAEKIKLTGNQFFLLIRSFR